MAITPTDDYDFGFSFADDDSLPSSAPVPQPSNEEIQELKDKLDSLLSAQEQTRNRNCRMLVLSLAYQPLVIAVIFSICLSITAVLFGQ